ncbi:MAG: serine/threonine-protein kinase [Solirubrobacterales bacterium]
MLLKIRTKREKAAWRFEEGTPISPGRFALKPIGGGSLYDVYLVWDEPMHAICVAKLIRPDQVDDPEALDDLREEAEILARLAHPVIVRGFGAVTDGPHPHLLIEHLEGPSLRRLIRRGGPLPLQQLLPLALHVAGALHYLEGEGLVHLDVKPDNLIMSVPPRLIDLSIARSIERAGGLRRAVGTDAYMSPEQADPEERRGRIGPPADVWGLGATLFHAASGSKPFPREKGDRDSEQPEVRFPQLVQDPIDPPPHLPAGLVELIDSVLEREPAGRPTAAQVAERLEPLIAELPHKLILSRRGSRVI